MWYWCCAITHYCLIFLSEQWILVRLCAMYDERNGSQIISLSLRFMWCIMLLNQSLKMRNRGCFKERLKLINHVNCIIKIGHQAAEYLTCNTKASVCLTCLCIFCIYKGVDTCLNDQCKVCCHREEDSVSCTWGRKVFLITQSQV